jgi:type I restriction enzyme S subunit
MTADQLRKSILQRAIQGKLVPQDPSDEPASVLIEKIREEKKRLVKEGKIKKSKNESTIFKGSDNCHYEKFENGTLKNIDEEIPFEIPKSWEWVRLEELVSVLGDGIHGTPTYDGCGEYYFINGNNLDKGKIIIKSDTKRISIAEYNKYRKDLNLTTILVSINGTIGNVAFYDNEPVILGKSACYFNLIHPEMKQYFRLLIESDYFFKYAFSNATGTTIKNVSLGTMRKLLIPLPSINEQKYIVYAANNILPQVELYAKYKQKSDQLEIELLSQLKKSLLQYAIQGKLVPQNPNDESTSKLLERIREEKKQLVQEKKIKVDKHESVIFKGTDNKYYEKIEGRVACIEEEIPFQIPESWGWVRLMSICSYIQRGKSPKYSDVKKYPVIAQKCNQWDNLSLEKALFITPDSILKYDSSRFIQEHDILMNSTGTIGRTGYFTMRVKENYDFVVADSHITVIRCMKEIYARYIYYYLCSPLVQNTVEEKADGSTNQIELNTSTVKSYLIPLPPFEEQKLIVSEIEPLLYKIKANLLFEEIESRD